MSSSASGQLALAPCHKLGSVVPSRKERIPPMNRLLIRPFSTQGRLLVAEVGGLGQFQPPSLSRSSGGGDPTLPPASRGQTAMSLSAGSSLYPRQINTAEESIMTATYTFDVFSSLDGFGSASGGDWGGYWGKQGPELLDHRLALYS